MELKLNFETKWMPNEVGEYIVLTRDKTLATLHYTPQGGWNTRFDANGNLIDRHRLSDDYVLGWAVMPDLSGLDEGMDCPSEEPW